MKPGDLTDRIPACGLDNQAQQCTGNMHEGMDSLSPFSGHISSIDIHHSSEEKKFKSTMSVHIFFYSATNEEELIE